MNAPVTTSLVGGVLVVRIDNPPVNALNRATIASLGKVIEDASADPATNAIVIAGAGRTFAAGVDIQELQAAAAGDAGALGDWNALFDRVERCEKPVVMAIHGAALGGGLELAMAGHFRVATKDARMGLPEVNLGLIPGGGGTQRLPRLVGLERALALATGGGSIGAHEARDWGLVDLVAEGDIIESATSFAKSLLDRGIPAASRRTSEQGVADLDRASSLLDAARQQLAHTRPSEIAPLKAVDAIARSAQTFADGLRAERDIFFECLSSDQARALMHAFFAERAASKATGRARDAIAAVSRSVGIIGATDSGLNLAWACATAGIRVFLADADRQAVDRAAAALPDRSRRASDAGATNGRAAEVAGLIRPQTGFAGFEAVDVVIETVKENVDTKIKALSDADVVAKPECVLATTTTTLDLEEIATATWRAQAVLGLQVFGTPAPSLIEVVHAMQTSPEVLATTIALAKRISPVTVITNNHEGFATARLRRRLLSTVREIVGTGIDISRVITALERFGFRLDGVTMADIKSIASSSSAGRASAELTDDATVEQMVTALSTEAAALLRDGVVERLSDVDVISIHGCGFPRWRGGIAYFTQEPRKA